MIGNREGVKTNEENSEKKLCEGRKEERTGMVNK